ncbi:MAG: CoA transferase [Alphaproteobacteria bacterium]|jgi:crotonobetainyl-CoA:carnitine CoA-transferase CaiB-like acyl-CoA transferase|nr:CoA transferase [Alphaproteobacteria bacterium]
MDDDAMILKGIKVLDVASFIAGPVAATIMADFGAEVIKVEPPGGDRYRNLHTVAGMPEVEQPYHWLVDNRNKRGLQLDLQNEAGREVLRHLASRADVFVTNYTRPARAKLGLRYQDLAPLNERLIYASLTAYGETGPEADQTGFDTTAYWARSGLMDQVRPDPDGPPARSMPGMGDHPTGVALLSAIMLALYRRDRTGKGGKVHTSLLANGAWSNAYMAQAALFGAAIPPRPRREVARNAMSNHYQSRDHRWFILTAANEAREWERFPAAVGRPELLTDKRFATTEARNANAALLVQILDHIFAERDWPYWRDTLAEHRITVGEVAKGEDILNDRQMHEGGALIDSSEAGIGVDRLIDSPIWVDGAVKRRPSRAPEVGEHTREILLEAGYDDAAIAELREHGAIGQET